MPWIQDTGRRTPPGTLQQPSNNNNNNNNQFFLQNRPLLSPGGLKVPQEIANHFGTTLASVRKRNSSLLPSRLQARLKHFASTGPIEMPTQLKVSL